MTPAVLAGVSNSYCNGVQPQGLTGGAHEVGPYSDSLGIDLDDLAMYDTDDFIDIQDTPELDKTLKQWSQEIQRSQGLRAWPQNYWEHTSSLAASQMQRDNQFVVQEGSRPRLAASRGHNNASQDQRYRYFEYGCDGRPFSCRENYLRHIRERGSQEARCPRCNVAFSRSSNRDAHKASGRCKALEVSRK